MKHSENIIERTGFSLAVLGGIAFASIFVIVFVNGSWPDFLWLVQSQFAIIFDFVGPWAFAVELFIFVGPGLLVYFIGQRLRRK